MRVVKMVSHTEIAVAKIPNPCISLMNDKHVCSASCFRRKMCEKRNQMKINVQN